MAPTPQETLSGEKGHSGKPLSGEEVVISGMSGIFPKSDSVLEFSDNLFNNVDMVSAESSRWVFNHPEVPKHLGTVTGMAKFDAQFFRVHYKQARMMEPMSRKLLEHAYSAIFDSGINPLQLRGRKVGVFIGSTFSESEKLVIYENVQRNGFGITGCNKAMYSNRISYWIDGKGPSYSLDLACASSTACLEHAYRAISDGQCDAAIVGGCNLCMHPNVSLNFNRAGFLCLDGKTKCFDKRGDGYVRSDAINVVFLQRAKDAKRIYAEVYHAKGGYATSIVDKFFPVRTPKEIEDFLKEFYSEIDVSPEDVEYVEGCGIASPEADSNELQAIGEIFAKETPIKVGCVKSNMGSSEPTSGLCSITKLCLAYHKGQLPANLHYDNPMDDIPVVKNNMVQILTGNAKFNRRFTALNSFSYSGANIHVLLKGHYKPKEPERYKTSIPHLVLASGREESCVRTILSTLNKSPVDPEQIGMLHTIHKYDIPGHMCRGYTILDTNDKKETVCLSQSIEYCTGITRPIWFVYSGMGSQWAGMGTELMRIPIFAAAIEKCRVALEPKGVDIVKILTDPDKTIYDNILHSFVGIAAVQIGLTDILRELGIVPDNIIGHSVGELGCAYADGCFSAEEMILSAYSRGLVSVQTPLVRGAMAAVGLGYKSIVSLCPPEIEVACHNSADSSTISGPVDHMKRFVAELSSQGIFAKEVPCSNIAYHSRYISKAGSGLLKYLSEVIKEPKPRSEKWVSTSVPQEQWNEPKAKYSSAEYHTNNLLNAVLFEETSILIPANAIVIEIAPHGLLQAILKRSLSECLHIPLTRRGHVDPVKFLLEAVGNLYQVGLQPNVEVLYPKIEYPVSTETPLLSHLVEWEHSEDWPQAKYNSKYRITSNERHFVMSINDDDFRYFSGHMRDGVCMFPEAAYLVIVWETFAMHKGEDLNSMLVAFYDVEFHSEMTIREEVPLRLVFMINKGDNKFEVSHENTAIVSGYIHAISQKDIPERSMIDQETSVNDIMLTSKDIYTIMNLRGHSYKNEFQSIEASNSSKTKASVKWTENWIPFIDSLIQFNAFARNHDGISAPKLIKSLIIDVVEHKKSLLVSKNLLEADRYQIHNFTRCGGVQLDGLVFTDKPTKEQPPDVLQTRSFVPHYIAGHVDIHTALQINLQVIAENTVTSKINIGEAFSVSNPEISGVIKKASSEVGSADFVTFKVDLENIESNVNVVITDDFLNDEKKRNIVSEQLSDDAFVLTFEKDTIKLEPNRTSFNIISVMRVHKHIVLLLKKAVSSADDVVYINVADECNFKWVTKVQDELEIGKRVVLVSVRQPYCGLLGLVKTLSKKFPNRVSLVLVDDFSHVPAFNPENQFYREQLRKNLVLNIVKKGLWGGYYYLSSNIFTESRNVKLISGVPGNLESLTWIETSEVPASSNKIQVCYSSVSIEDAQHACGKYAKKNRSFGMGFSGIDQGGKRVMGLVSGGSLASTVIADPDLLWPVPDHWSLEDAATVPWPYIYAYYCLSVKSEILSNITLMVNGADSAVGLAAISLALGIGCDVYATVSDVKKKEFLLRVFPELHESHIGNSNVYYQEVSLLNNDTKCQIVINAMSGQMRRAAFNCVDENCGQFFDLCEYDTSVTDWFGMKFLSKSRSYVVTHLSTIFKREYAKEKKIIHSLLTEGIAKGIVKPLNRLVYSPQEISRAFRLLCLNKQRGTVLVKMSSESNKSLEVMPRITYPVDGCYVVVSNESPLGVELIDRLVKAGVKNLVVHMKPNTISGYCYTKLISWRKYDVNIKIITDDIHTEKECKSLLLEGKKLGPVFGIFIVQDFNSQPSEDVFKPEAFAMKFNQTIGTVANMDNISRNVCSDLKYFVVLKNSSGCIIDEYVSAVTDKICQSRTDVTLPALIFRVEQLNVYNERKDGLPTKIKTQTLPTVFCALESCLKQKLNNVVTFNIHKETVFADKINDIIGVKSFEEIPENYQLSDILLGEISIMEMQKAILDAYEVNCPIDILKNMTIKNLKEIEKNIVKPKTNFYSGLGAFYTSIEDDECHATEPLITMRTMYSNVQKEEELDPKATYLMMIPGFEGHHQIFHSICERLKIQALTLQLTPDLTNENIQQMASNVMKFMKKRFELKSKFYLLGYSFGVNIALELAHLIEKEGHVGVVYCLDSSPDALKAQLDAYLGKDLTEDALQNTIVRHMFKLMSGEDNEDLAKQLAAKESWSDKIEVCVNKSRGLVKYSRQYVRSVLQVAYLRIKLAKEYQPSFKLQSELVLMRAKPHPRLTKLSYDYNLSKYSTNLVKVFDLESDHALAPHDCRVVNIINRLLEPKLQEEFKKKSLLETYLGNPDKII